MSLRYPRELNPSSVDYVVFTPEEYRTNKSYKGQEAGFSSAPAAGQSILLYMPNSTPAMGNENMWDRKNEPGPLGDLKRNLLSATTSIAMNAGTGEGGDLIDGFKAQMEDVKSKGGQAARQVGLNMVGAQANYSGSALLALQRGQVYNPNVELLYQGPNLRRFSFDYTFIPKSPFETADINSIIMAFKKSSAPSASGGMLKVPNVWRVTYMSKGGQNPYMNAFKKAALTGVTVVHNQGTDMHTAFADGMPITTQIQLQFMEVDIILSDDHDSSGSLQGY